MAEPKTINVTDEQVLLAATAQGQGALAGLAQLVTELEPTIGVGAAERVREKAIEAIKATRLPAELEQAFLRQLR